MPESFRTPYRSSPFRPTAATPGWITDMTPAPEVDLIASIEHKLSLGLLTGFVIQGLVPYGRTPCTRAAS